MRSSKDGYKAIFFDLDGTLRHSVPIGSDVFREEASKLGFSISDEVHRKAGQWEHYYWASSDELRADSDKFDGDNGAFWENYSNMRLDKMGATKKEMEQLGPKIRKAFDKSYKPKDWIPPELHQLLPEFRSAGYTLAVLSNRRSPFKDEMKKLGLIDYFDAVMGAGEIGVWKPDPKTFAPLLEQFALSPEEVVYIGDNYYADIIGARNAGLKPVLYDPRSIFPDADCIRITSFLELEDVLENASN